MTKYDPPRNSEASARLRMSSEGQLPSTRLPSPKTLDPRAGLVRIRPNVIGLAFTAALLVPLPWTAEATATSPEAIPERNVMHPVESTGTSGESETLVLFETVETWDEYREKTEDTYVDEKGETQPLYRLLEPQEGNTYLHLVAHVSTGTPQAYATDEVLLIGPSGDEPVWQSAPMVIFDPNGVPRDPGVVEPSRKVALDLLYEVPRASWSEFFLEIDGRQYGPLKDHIDTIPSREDPDAAGRLR